MIAFDTYSRFWNIPYKRAHTTETTALSRSWKKTAIGIRVSVSKFYVTFCGAAANWGLEWLFVYVPRSNTHIIRHTNEQTHTNTHTRQDSPEWVTSSSHRPLLIHNTQQNKERKFHANIWTQTRNSKKETNAELHNKPVNYRDRRSQYGILSLHLCWLTNVIECRYVEMVERQKELLKETF